MRNERQQERFPYRLLRFVFAETACSAPVGRLDASAGQVRDQIAVE